MLVTPKTTVNKQTNMSVPPGRKNGNTLHLRIALFSKGNTFFHDQGHKDGEGNGQKPGAQIRILILLCPSWMDRMNSVTIMIPTVI